MKYAAFQFLGPFLYQLRESEIDQSLIDIFLGMGDPRNGTTNSDNTYHCAYNFPAVLLTLGKDQWKTLRRLYMILAKDS